LYSEETVDKEYLLKKTLHIFAFFILMVLLSLQICSGCSTGRLEFFDETRDMMDTYIRIGVYTENREKAQEVINAAFTRIEEIELAATIYDSAGEAFQLNETGFLENPADDLIEMLNYSKEYFDLTGGYFDITVQPLLDLYTFDPNAEAQFWELDEETRTARINAVMNCVGTDRIIIENGTVRLLEGTKITLGGIAKGYAADEALKVIAGKGITSALVDAGGDTKTLGSKPDGSLWNVTLVNPDDTTEFLADFYVSGMAVMTSGNYERYFSPDKKASHILNPKTGMSAPGTTSVTIITRSGIMADALATGVMAMGTEAGLALIETLDGTEAMIIDQDLNIHKSSGLSKYMNQ
jgi:thiamine biosynthesis lipoprotein